MTRSRAMLILVTCLSISLSACATKRFVRDQLKATETKISGQFETRDTKLQQTADRAAASGQAIDAAAHRLQGLDARVGELDTAASTAQTAASSAQTAASSAQTRAEQAAEVARDSGARLSQRIADRNKYRLLQSRYIYFESDRTDVRDAGFKELEEVAQVLEADPNALVELQGFADPRGSDRYNQELARERVEVVIRHLVRRGIELRQIRSIAMGKVTLAAGERPSAEVLANARRVEIRLLTPWSSWEDSQAGIDGKGDWPAASGRHEGAAAGPIPRPERDGDK